MCSMLGCSSTGVCQILLYPGYLLSRGRTHLQVSFPAKSLTPVCFRRRWKRTRTLISSKPFSAEISVAEEDWIKKLPEKKKPLYSHSLPCIEAWLKKVGFYQSSTDRAVWYIERLDWHARLSLDVTDLYISLVVFLGGAFFSLVVFLRGAFSLAGQNARKQNMQTDSMER